MVLPNIPTPAFSDAVRLSSWCQVLVPGWRCRCCSTGRGWTGRPAASFATSRSPSASPGVCRCTDGAVDAAPRAGAGHDDQLRVPRPPPAHPPPRVRAAARLTRGRTRPLAAYTEPATAPARPVDGQDAAAHRGPPISRAGLLHPRDAWPARVRRRCALRVSLCTEPVSSSPTSASRAARGFVLLHVHGGDSLVDASGDTSRGHGVGSSAPRAGRAPSTFRVRPPPPQPVPVTVARLPSGKAMEVAREGEGGSGTILRRAGVSACIERRQRPLLSAPPRPASSPPRCRRVRRRNGDIQSGDGR